MRPAAGIGYDQAAGPQARGQPRDGLAWRQQTDMAQNETGQAAKPASPSLRQQRRMLAAYLGPQRRKVALLAALLAANIGLQLISPLILRSFIDAALGSGSLSLLFGAAGLFLGAALGTQL